MLLQFFFSTIIFFGTLGVLIVIHECGHFLVARFFEEKIERFSIGFGPVLWSKKDSYGTEYTISAILIGGYVKLIDTSFNESKHYHSFNRSFYHSYFWKKSLIIVAGPIFNFLFAILLYTIVYISGILNYKPIINYILPNSIVACAKIPIGSEIKQINGILVNDWESVRFQILSNINKEQITVFTELVNNRNIVSKISIIDLPKNWINQSILDTKDPLIILGMLPNVLRVISIIEKEELYFFNEQKQLQINDKILLINGQPIYNLESFIQIIKNNINKILHIVIERNKCVLTLHGKLIGNHSIDDKAIQKNIDLFSDTIIVESTVKLNTYRYGLCSAILKSMSKVWQYICFIMHTLFKLISGNINIVNLHGPIAISKIANQTARCGIIHYFVFLAIVSINLGVINLIPFPILDGGQLLLLIIEKIYGQPMSSKIQNFIYIISCTVLIIIMLITAYNDIDS